mgnify:CR=1 FL=1
MSGEIIDSIGGRLDRVESRLEITIKGQMYTSLVRLSKKMRNANAPKDVVEIALELIMKAEDKEIVLMDQGHMVASYDLWH